MNSVIVRLVGGLGNQMFQYAAARALSVRIGTSLELDLSWFGTEPDRQYALAPFSIKANIYKGQSQIGTVSSLMAKVARRLHIARGLPIFSEASFLYDSRIEKIHDPVFLNGYFQTEKYFASIRQDIVDDFFLKTLPIPAAAAILIQIASKDAICVHIRRGDYITNPTANAYHGVCSLEYYRDSIRYLSNNLRNPHCFVFSDDPDWVRENFSTDIPVTLVDIHRIDQAHEDLRLMSACKCFVIANSSLSWWGAWLGKDANKIVVAPAKWFSKSNIDTTDLIPPDWLKL